MLVTSMQQSLRMTQLWQKYIWTHFSLKVSQDLHIFGRFKTIKHICKMFDFLYGCVFIIVHCWFVIYISLLPFLSNIWHSQSIWRELLIIYCLSATTKFSHNFHATPSQWRAWCISIKMSVSSGKLVYSWMFGHVSFESIGPATWVTALCALVGFFSSVN